MVIEDLFKYLRGLTKKQPFTASSLKEIAIKRGYSEEDARDTIKYLEEYEKLFKGKADVTAGKLAGMIVITWFAFPGLLNLIVLWRDESQRIKSIIALGLSLALYIAYFANPYVFVGILTSAWFVFGLGLKIWMTVEASMAYKTSKALKSKIWTVCFESAKLKLSD
ncbi:MAG: hypothetical protein QMD05_03455 [Candidatus Brocadiaceae bacterium]|nr:hypothetical protein [Candidatus Brocadiaceae bacterium]